MDHVIASHLCFIFFLDLAGDLAKYDLEYVIGAGAFGQAIAATRKTDNVPVSGIKKHTDMNSELLRSFFNR